MKASCFSKLGILTAIAPLLQLLVVLQFADAQIEPRPPYFQSSSRLAGLYYNDSDDNRRYDQSLQTGFLLDKDLQFDLEVLHHDANSNSGSEEFYQGWASLSKQIEESEFITFGLGLGVYEEGQKALGSLRYFRRKPKYFLLGQLAHKPLVDTKDIVSNKIRYTQFLTEADYEFHPSFRPRIKAEYNEYSDNNSEIRTKLDMPYKFLFQPVSSQIGYRIEYANFRRQSGGGYFDPSELISHQGFIALWHWSETSWFYFEVSSGRQDIERNGNSTKDNFAAFYSEMEFRLTKDFSLGAFFEGGDYSLGSASGFNYLQAIAYLVWHLDEAQQAAAVNSPLTRQ